MVVWKTFTQIKYMCHNIFVARFILDHAPVKWLSNKFYIQYEKHIVTMIWCKAHNTKHMISEPKEIFLRQLEAKARVAFGEYLKTPGAKFLEEKDFFFMELDKYIDWDKINRNVY